MGADSWVPELDTAGSRLGLPPNAQPHPEAEQKHQTRGKLADSCEALDLPVGISVPGLTHASCPQRSSADENSSDNNLCAVLKRANLRMQCHTRGCPEVHPSGTASLHINKSLTHSCKQHTFPHAPAPAGSQQTLGRVRLSPRQQANYRQRTTGTGRL